MKKSLKSKKGFALIELLVVIFIIALLAALILAATQSARARGRDGRRKADLDSIKKAIELYRSDFGGNVPDCVSPPCLSTAGSNWIPGISPNFIGAVPRDPSDPSTAIRYRYADGPIAGEYELDAIFEDASNNGLEANDGGDCNTQPTARYETGFDITGAAFNILSTACGT